MESTCDSQWVYFAVADSGPGVPDDMRDRIFEPFFTTKPIGKGTGLGLAIVHRIADANYGSISVSNKGSGGAAFVLAVPRGGRGGRC